MKVVIDTSPLISLAVLGQLDLLNILFPSLIVPKAVYEEIETAGKREEYIKIAKFIENRICTPKKEREFSSKLGKGETEAIALCIEMKADLLIIDDRKARITAESHNIKCLGTLGMLTLAKKKGYIKELRKYFTQLLENERYFSISLLNQILQANKEEPL
jgi:predicted nucleic acid-binding protein